MPHTYHNHIKNHSHQQPIETGPKTARNILVAFILNLGFSIYEFIGGSLTGSVAIVSDAIHDIGDALSIGLAFLLEKKSQRKPDAHYTYGYIRYSLIGSLITTIILLIGSVFVIYSAISRFFQPIEIKYNGMIILAIIGVIVNFAAAYFTRHGDSLNQKSVNLHMLEDVLGWAVVLIGAIVMRFTNWNFIDPLLSILVALFIFKEALTTGYAALSVFLEKAPVNLDPTTVRTTLMQVSGVEDVHHLHIWSIDGFHNYATLHLVTNQNPNKIKPIIRTTLRDLNIEHVTIETESPDMACDSHECINPTSIPTHHHHHS